MKTRNIRSVILNLLFGSHGVAKFSHKGSSRPHVHTHSLAQRKLPPSTCDNSTVCVNGACCSTSNNCGYGPSFCGSGNCTSNCDAEAECGQYAGLGNERCSLNICCSKYGSCGTTDEFCGAGCQNGCGQPSRPECGRSNTSAQRIVGYYESWSNGRLCQRVAPENLNVTGFTHINFGFLLFDPSTFAIAPASDGDISLLTRFTDLKSTNPGLQTWVSIGGWSFTDPGPTLTAFSDMVGSPANRTKFIMEVTSFMETYAVDGLDLDWEYPAASDRGGRPDDKHNYVQLAREFRTAFGSKYGLSMTLPMSPFYLKHFDVESLQVSVDYFNVMSYDIHGVWDKDQVGVGPFIRPHTNITEIDDGLDLLWRAKVAPSRVNLGLAWYGRSFTLENPDCSEPNGVCRFTESGFPGLCSNVAGTLDLEEIEDIIVQNTLQPSFDQAAAVRWILWNASQWVSYDDEETIKIKQSFANSRCLGGTMVWAMDQASQNSSCGLPRVVRQLPNEDSNPASVSYNNASMSNATACTGQFIVGSTRRSVTSLGHALWSRQTNSSCDALSLKYGIPTASLQVLSGSTACRLGGSICAPYACTTSYLESNATCAYIAQAVNITVTQFKRWNPHLMSSDCDDLRPGQYVCISPPGGWYDLAPPPLNGLSSGVSSQPSILASESSSASPGTASAAASKTQSGIVPNCKSYAKATSGDFCVNFASAHNISPSQLYAWNAMLGDNGSACSAAFLADESYCIRTSGSGGSSSTPTSAVTTPSFQPSAPLDVSTIPSGASISTVTVYNTATVYETAISTIMLSTARFPDRTSTNVGQSSTKLVPEFTYDPSASTISRIPSSSPIASKATTSSPSIALPTLPIPTISPPPPASPTAPPDKIQKGLTSKCTLFAEAQTLSTCVDFALAHGVPIENLYAWNSILRDAGEDCGVNFWAGYWYCVGVRAH